MLSEPFQIQRELRYGAPVCDQILTGRYYTIGYSWYFRQAKWSLEIINRERRLVNPEEEAQDRLDNFRTDVRIPPRFRAGLKAYYGSGYDRGHLTASANQILLPVQNSETFLLSNMSPQCPQLNRNKWRLLEEAVRDLDSREDILETYVLTCPVFYFNKIVETIGKSDKDHGIDVPVPHAFIKSVLSEDKKGKLNLWTFKMENEDQSEDLANYLIPTYDAEQLVGGQFWDRVSGNDLHNMKDKAGDMWSKRSIPDPEEARPDPDSLSE